MANGVTQPRVGKEDIKSLVKSEGLGTIPESDFRDPKVAEQTADKLELLQRRGTRALQGKEDQIGALRNFQGELFDEARKRKGLSSGEKIALGTIFTLTPLIGGLLGGARGAAIGAQAGTQASLGFLKDIGKERDDVRAATLKQADAIGGQAKQLRTGEQDIDKIALKTLLPNQGSQKDDRFFAAIPGIGTIPVVRRGTQLFRLGGTPIPPELADQAKRPSSIRIGKHPVTGQLFVGNAEGGVTFLDNNEAEAVKSAGFPVESQAQESIPATAGQGPVQPVAEPKQRPGFPSSKVVLRDFTPDDSPVISSMKGELSELIAQRSTPGANLINLDAEIKDLRGDLDRRETEFFKAVKDANGAQAAARGSSRRLGRIFDLKQDVDTGFFADFAGSVLDKFNSTTQPERVKLRSQAQFQLSKFIKSISGSAVSEQEAERLSLAIATMDKDDDAFVAALEAFALEIEDIRREKLEATALFADPDEANIPESSLQQQPQRPLQGLSDEELLQRKRQLEGAQ